MKLRFKYLQTTRFVLSVEDTLPYSGLATTVWKFMTDSLTKNVDGLCLSLDGKNGITAPKETQINNFLVSGDLVHIIEQDRSVMEVVGTTKSPVVSIIPQVPKVQPNPTKFSEAQSGQIPDVLKLALDKYKPESQNDLINLMLHLNMIENGFKLEPNDNLPDTWKDISTNMTYSVSNTFSFTLTIVTMLNEKLVFAAYKGQEIQIQWKFKFEDVFEGSEFGVSSLRDIKAFINAIKDNIVYPIQLASHSHEMGVPSLYSLAGLPVEILHCIALKLDIKSLLTLSQTCKKLNQSLDDNILWFKVYKKRYGQSGKVTDQAVWKVAYQIKFKEEKLKRLRDNERSPFLEEEHPFMYPLPSYPRPPYLPGYPDNEIPGPYGVPEQPAWNPYIDPDSPYYQPGMNPRMGGMPGAYPALPGMPLPNPNLPRMPNPFHQPNMNRNRRRGPPGPRFDFI